MAKLKFLILICILFYSKRSDSQIENYLTFNYVYSEKWTRGNDFAYYFDVPENHTFSVVLNSLIRCQSFLKNTNDKSLLGPLGFGTSVELIYLPISGLHYVDREFDSTVNGIDQWLVHYNQDRYSLGYGLIGLTASYEEKKLGFVRFGIQLPVLLFKSGKGRELHINNITGAYEYSEWTTIGTERVQSPEFFWDAEIGFNMSQRLSFVLGFQWAFKSSIDLNYIEYSVDNREQAYRNIKIGWRWAL